jgi:hypothetical protein
MKPMDLIYLDYNCFQRRFDDSRQIRIPENLDWPMK